MCQLLFILLVCASCYLYRLVGNLTKNVHSATYPNVYHDSDMKYATNY